MTEWWITCYRGNIHKEKGIYKEENLKEEGLKEEKDIVLNILLFDILLLNILLLNHLLLLEILLLEILLLEILLLEILLLEILLLEILLLEILLLEILLLEILLLEILLLEILLLEILLLEILLLEILLLEILLLEILFLKVQTRMLLGDNSKYFELVYVHSAALAHVLDARALLDNMHNTPHSKVDGEAFFISDGAPMKFWDFTRAVWAAAGDTTRPEDVKVIPMWLIQSLASIGEWSYWVCTFGRKSPKLRRQNLEFISAGHRFSIQKARTRLGYEPVCDTLEGIRRTVAWFKENEGWNKVERAEDKDGLFSRLVQASRPLIVPWRVFFGNSFESSMFEGKNFY
ncbi:hypothetical protein EPUS_05870 [Endocarpon pusillum Z07020]|uniref:3-beta hydroxysteroid dehydrogenase/isomerase domain-containing protein n=1 Tax=Endocarpon pusillum (strain Z07020 / HMAS-L-300199) TaxID=1263415 RepID=U1GNI7_ENDPU|nr:uncharacterized protein EPUS_05870 [Endocarpon pusillum Z07020]ERF73858.1 hypothetical protein EPUS_05870 [Endocarpon pusillum Z07020]